MSTLWPHWFRPEWLLILPLLGWLLWQRWHREKRAGRWQKILPPAFHRVLLSGGSGRSSKLPWIALGLGWLLALLALLGPSWQRVEQSSQKPEDPSVASISGVSSSITTSGSSGFCVACSTRCQLGPSNASRASSQPSPRAIHGNLLLRPVPPLSNTR